MNEGATVYDLVRAVRADEAHHRLLHHTLASLGEDMIKIVKPACLPADAAPRAPDHRHDTNPFALAEPDACTKATVPGFSREEAAAFAKQALDAAEQKAREVREADAIDCTEVIKGAEAGKSQI